MSRTALILICTVTAIGGLVMIAHAQDAGAGTAASDYRQHSVLKREPTPATPRATDYRTAADEPAPAAPADYRSVADDQDSAGTSSVSDRPSAAERLQYVRQAANRNSAARPAGTGATVVGPVTADPTQVRSPRTRDSANGGDVVAPTRPSSSLNIGDQDSGNSILKKPSSGSTTAERSTARRILRSRPSAANDPQTISPAPAALPIAAAPKTAQAQTVIQTQSPTLRVETEGPPTMKIGTEAVYQIHVHNDGAIEANDVFVRVGLPTSAKAVAEGSAAEGSQSSDAPQEQRFVWTIASLPARGHETLTLRVTPTTGEPIDLFVDWTIRPVSAVAQIEVLQPQLEMSVFGPKDIAYGEAARYTIRLSNPGTGDADNIQVEFGYGQEKLEPKQIGTLAAGQQQEISLELTARQAGALPVVAVATAEGGLRAEAQQEVLVRRASLVTEVAGEPAVFAGSPARYRVVVRNAGNAPATQVTAFIGLPEGARLLQAGEEASPAQNGLVWNVGSLPANGERSLELQTELTVAGENALNVRVEGANELQSTGSFVTRVEALADLKLSVNDPQGPVAVGQDALYEIHIQNHGTKAATKINVIAQFSAGIEPVEATGAPAELVTGQVLFEAVPRIDPGQKVTLIVRAKADSQGPKRFRVEVACEELDIQLVAQETTYFFTDAAPRTTSSQGSATKR